MAAKKRRKTKHKPGPRGIPSGTQMNFPGMDGAKKKAGKKRKGAKKHKGTKKAAGAKSAANPLPKGAKAITLGGKAFHCYGKRVRTGHGNKMVARAFCRADA